MASTSLTPSSPSFLVPNINNVNDRYSAAVGLLIAWDMKERKRRISNTNIIVSNKNDSKILKILPAKNNSRYFEEGRVRISWRIKKRLGKYKNVPGLMGTLTYDPKKISKWEAWKRIGGDTRRFLNSVNQYRRRRGWRRLHYLYVIEVQKETGYPHVHIFFPNLKWIAPLEILNSNWPHGRSNIESPKRIMLNCVGYITKYLSKMTNWTDLHLALLHMGGCRMYGFSRGFSAKEDIKIKEWERRWVLRTNDIEKLKQSLEDGGYLIENDEKGGDKSENEV